MPFNKKYSATELNGTNLQYFKDNSDKFTFVDTITDDKAQMPDKSIYHTFHNKQTNKTLAVFTPVSGVPIGVKCKAEANNLDHALRVYTQQKTQHDFLLFPMVQTARHWVCVVKDEEQLTLYESKILSGDTTGITATFYEFFQLQMVVICLSQQWNRIDCGPFTLRNLWALAASQRPNSTLRITVALRQEDERRFTLFAKSNPHFKQIEAGVSNVHAESYHDEESELLDDDEYQMADVVGDGADHAKREETRTANRPHNAEDTTPLAPSTNSSTSCCCVVM